MPMVAPILVTDFADPELWAQVHLIEIWNLLLMTTKGALAKQSNELLSRLCWDPCKEHYPTEFFRL